MNINKVSYEMLSTIAGFQVDGVINENHREEITLIGVNPTDVLVMSHKDFWKGYRRCS